jgi:hypothetical protein
MSNMGGDEAVVLNRLRDEAIAGVNPQLGHFEWSAPDGCELDDTAAWAQANPAVGYLFGESSIRSAMAAPPSTFRAETLCQRVDSIDAAVDLAAWRDCADAGGTMDGLRNRIDSPRMRNTSRWLSLRSSATAGSASKSSPRGIPPTRPAPSCPACSTGSSPRRSPGIRQGPAPRSRRCCEGGRDRPS